MLRFAENSITKYLSLTPFQLKAENKPIGSGVVEAACKSIVQLRLKRSGQRWDDDGGQAILTFRSLVKSNQFDQAWELIKDFYQQNLQLPKNVIKFPEI